MLRDPALPIGMEKRRAPWCSTKLGHSPQPLVLHVDSDHPCFVVPAVDLGHQVKGVVTDAQAELGMANVDPHQGRLRVALVIHHSREQLKAWRRLVFAVNERDLVSMDLMVLAPGGRLLEGIGRPAPYDGGPAIDGEGAFRAGRARPDVHLHLSILDAAADDGDVPVHASRFVDGVVWPDGVRQRDVAKRLGVVVEWEHIT